MIPASSLFPKEGKEKRGYKNELTSMHKRPMQQNVKPVLQNNMSYPNRRRTTKMILTRDEVWSENTLSCDKFKTMKQGIHERVI